MGGAVVDPQVAGTPPDVHAEALPGERLLKNSLPKVAGEKEGIWLTTPQGCKKPEMGNADVLRLVYNYKIEYSRLVLRDHGCQRAK